MLFGSIILVKIFGIIALNVHPHKHLPSANIFPFGGFMWYIVSACFLYD